MQAPASSTATRFIQALPTRSRKPGGSRREGQRSGDRRIPAPDCPVQPEVILGLFTRRWRGKYDMTLPWRLRGLAVLAVAMSVPPGTTTVALCRMLPAEVLALPIPRVGRKWVVRWLRTRRQFLGDLADHQPWLSSIGSRGMPKQIEWAACRTLHRAGVPAWRLGRILRSRNWRFVQTAHPGPDYPM